MTLLLGVGLVMLLAGFNPVLAVILTVPILGAACYAEFGRLPNSP